MVCKRGSLFCCLLSWLPNKWQAALGSWANARAFLRSKIYIKGEIEDENTDRSTEQFILLIEGKPAVLTRTFARTRGGNQGVVCFHSAILASKIGRLPLPVPKRDQ